MEYILVSLYRFWRFYSVSTIWILKSKEFPRVGSPQPLLYTRHWGYTTQSGCSKGDVKAIVTAVSLTTFGNIERPNMWNRQLKMVGLARVTCNKSGNRLPSCIPTVSFWALQVLWRQHQRCRWGRRLAGSLAELSRGKVELWALRSNSVHRVAASSQWRVARPAWCTWHPRGGVAPHPWQLRLEAASGALGGCGGCGVARGDGRIICFMGSKKIEVDLLYTTCECLPSLEPSCERYGMMI